jgi:hypothetical protein
MWEELLEYLQDNLKWLIFWNLGLNSRSERIHESLNSISSQSSLKITLSLKSQPFFPFKLYFIIASSFPLLLFYSSFFLDNLYMLLFLSDVGINHWYEFLQLLSNVSVIPLETIRSSLQLTQQYITFLVLPSISLISFFFAHL